MKFSNDDLKQIRKIEIFLGRIDNMNGTLFYKTHPYWDIHPDWWCHE